jgi:hypothetical protein
VYVHLMWGRPPYTILVLVGIVGLPTTSPDAAKLMRGAWVDVAHGELVEQQLDAMIQRRARKGDVDPDEREELWKARIRAYEEKRRQMARAGASARIGEMWKGRRPISPVS